MTIYRLLRIVLAVLLVPLPLLADHLPFSFVNNGIRLVTSRSGSDDKSYVRLDVKAPEKTEVVITEAENPARIILDFRNARLTRNRAFPIKDSPIITNIRFGVHANFFRVVIEFNTKTVPLSTYSETGDWFTLLVTEVDKKRGIGVDKAKDKEIMPWEKKESELKFSANLWNKTTADTKDDSETEQDKTNYLEVKPEVVYTYDNNIDAAISSRLKLFSEFDSDNESRDSDEFEARLYNAYVSYSGDFYSLKAGNQTVTWGKADEISPLDNVNPEDYREGPVRRKNERKIPVPMLNAELFARGDRLQAIFIPFYKRSRINYYGTDWAVAGSEVQQLDIDEDYPSHSLDNADYGLRYMSNAGSVDYSLSFLSTISDLPSIKTLMLPPGVSSVPSNVSISDIADFANETMQPLGLEYNRREIFGFDFETVADSIGIRGDFAYTRSEDYLNTVLEAEQRDTYRYVIGADYTSSNDFYINLQFLQSIISDYDSDLLLNEEVQSGIFAEISQELFNNNLKIGFRSLNGFPQTQYFYNPYMKLQYWDNFNFEFGADMLGGDENSPLGFYSNNDEVYLIFTAFY